MNNYHIETQHVSAGDVEWTARIVPAWRSDYVGTGRTEGIAIIDLFANMFNYVTIVDSVKEKS